MFSGALPLWAGAPPAKVILPERKPTPPPPRTSAAPAVETAAPTPSVTVSVPASTLSTREKQILNEAMKSAQKRQWAKARSTIALARNPLLSKIIDWAYLREPGNHASFSERTAFLAANPGWPSADTIRRRAEDAIDGSDSLFTLNTWFAAHPPLSTAGKVAYARALRAAGENDKATMLAREAWTKGSFSRDDERSFLATFRDVLTRDDHWARIDNLLYDEETTTALQLMPMVDANRQLIVKARIALITSAKNIDGVVAAIPDSMQDDPGLLYDRIKWRRSRDNDIGARQLMPAHEVVNPRPDLWWHERHALARDALAAGNVTEAYTIAKHHGTADALSVSEAEWLAGWIALRFLKDGEAALAHFEKVYDSVETPPSLARGRWNF